MCSLSLTNAFICSYLIFKKKRKVQKGCCCSKRSRSLDTEHQHEGVSEFESEPASVCVSV